MTSLLLGVYSRKIKTYVHTKTSAWSHKALFLKAKKWKPPKCRPTGEPINKQRHLPIREYDSAIKRNELPIHATTREKIELLCCAKEARLQREYTLKDGIYTNFEEVQTGQVSGSLRTGGRGAPFSGDLKEGEQFPGSKTWWEQKPEDRVGKWRLTIHSCFCLFLFAGKSLVSI